MSIARPVLHLQDSPEEKGQVEEVEYTRRTPEPLLVAAEAAVRASLLANFIAECSSSELGVVSCKLCAIIVPGSEICLTEPRWLGRVCQITC